MQCYQETISRASNRLWRCREQLTDLSKILERADPVLFHHLRHIKAADCFFAYRMVIVQLRREMPMEQVKITRTLPSCLGPAVTCHTDWTPQHASMPV